MLNCESFKQLLNSNVNCDILREIRYWANLSELSHSTETLRELVISRGKKQFSNKVQSDPAEFIQCLFDLSEPIKKLFQFNIKESKRCLGDNCSEITYSNAIDVYSLKEGIEEKCMDVKSISGIIEKKQGCKC